MRRKIEDERDARRCVTAAEASGLPLVAWARAHGVDGRSLRAWQLNLSRRMRNAPGLVELVARAPARESARYVVRVGELSIELRDDFDEATLTRLVRTLRTC